MIILESLRLITSLDQPLRAVVNTQRADGPTTDRKWWRATAEAHVRVGTSPDCTLGDHGASQQPGARATL
jgi:hypothetical protein